jgi:hypothetical protein
VIGAASLGELAVARWDAEGAVRSASPAEQAAQLTTAVGARVTSWGQLGLSLPVRVDHRSADVLSDSGAGVGDARATVVLDPFTARRAPRPVATFGLRLPTGRDWTEADGALLADVTGLPGVGGTGMLTLEHVTGDGPWWIGVDGAADPGTPARAALSGAWGRYAGTRTTWLATARHERQLASGGTARTTVGGRVILSTPARWRAWLGVASDVPVPVLGAGLPITVSLDLGGAFVR